MSRRCTVHLFALAFFFCAFTAVAQETVVVASPEAVTGSPAADLAADDLAATSDPFLAPIWMQENSLGAGCTYSQCMRHCTEEWIVCHTICNRDCDNQQHQ